MINKGFFTLGFVVLAISASLGTVLASEEKPIKEVSEDDYIGDVPL